MQFEITPSPRRDGFTLSSPMLLFSLGYPTFEAAVNYAKFLAREVGCDIRVNTPDGRHLELIEMRVKRSFPKPRFSLNGRNAVELQACNMELRQQIASMTRLEYKLLESNEREHRQFGQDLHEDLGQHLAGITFLVSLLAKQPNCSDIGKELSELVIELRTAISQTREIARSLYPIGLENGGLFMVLEEFAEWTSRSQAISCEFTHDDQFEPPQDSAIHLYRIVQEAVNYLLKTGQATRICIECRVIDSIQSLIVTGEGVQLETHSLEQVGLIHSRARMIGAEITLGDTSRSGCKITCALRHPEQALLPILSGTPQE